MIPPIKEVRLRSINRWLKDKGQTTQSGAQSPRAQDLDDQMIEAFEEQDDALMDRLMKANLWGDGGRSAAVSDGTDGVVAGGVRRVSADFRPGLGALTREGSWFDAAKRNIDLIELAIQIDKEKRNATTEEQAQLAKYVGFGASEIRNALFPIPGEYAKRLEPNRLVWPNLVRDARWKPLAERIDACRGSGRSPSCNRRSTRTTPARESSGRSGALSRGWDSPAATSSSLAPASGRSRCSCLTESTKHRASPGLNSTRQRR